MTTYNDSPADPLFSASSDSQPDLLFASSQYPSYWQDTGALQNTVSWRPPVIPRAQRAAARRNARHALLWRTVAYALAFVAVVAGTQAIWQAVGTDVYTSVRQAYMRFTSDEIPLDPLFAASGQDDPTFAVGPSRVNVAPILRGAPSAAEGEPVARMVIDKIDMDWLIVQGVSVSALKNGPGWMPFTAFPGEPGNSVLSGHRTTYGAPFNRLDELEVGDTIRIAVEGRPTATYTVTESFIVDPEDVWVVDPLDGAFLTLTTCTPEGSSEFRLIIRAELTAGEFASYASSSTSS